MLYQNNFLSSKSDSLTFYDGITTTPFYDNCINPHYVGDSFCDDITNNQECNFDGGDCCGSNVITSTCTECQCLSDGAMIGKYCGSLIPPSFISASNKAFIRFQSNGNWANAGFKLEYHPFSKFIP